MTSMCETLPLIKSDFFSSDELESLNELPVPHHVAIIMDGNRRWAKGRHAQAKEGHHQGADTLMDIVRGAKDLGIKVLTVYAFSTENWNRTQAEIEILFQLLNDYVSGECQTMIENGIRLETIGDTSAFPDQLQRTIRETKAATAHCQDITLVLSLNYGSRNEICRAVKRIVGDVEAGKLNKSAISEQTIDAYLDTAAWPDPELLIRTSGELRISNFLLWQISYSELYVTETLWPDFSPRHLLKAVQTFQARERRKGS